MTDKAIDPRYAPPPELSIVWYSDPVDVHRELWRSAAEENGMTVDELLDSSEFMGLGIDGNEISVSNQQAFEGMAEMGCWGWVDTESNTIHAWADKDADPEMVLHMLAHEIGHITGVPDSDPLQEEMRAEQFGFVAKLALQLMDGRNQPCKGGSKANSYRKRPIEVEAVQWNAPVNGRVSLARDCTDHASVRHTDYMEVFEMLGTSGCSASEPYWSWEVIGVIDTLEGKHVVTPGDWIIKGVAGEFYPCKPDIFAATYELVP